jgi:hypothetical protein
LGCSQHFSLTFPGYVVLIFIKANTSWSLAGLFLDLLRSRRAQPQVGQLDYHYFPQLNAFKAKASPEPAPKVVA